MNITSELKGVKGKILMFGTGNELGNDHESFKKLWEDSMPKPLPYTFKDFQPCSFSISGLVTRKLGNLIVYSKNSYV